MTMKRVGMTLLLLASIEILPVCDLFKNSHAPPTQSPLGLGLGTVENGTTCWVKNSTTENPGSYCVRVYDVGNLTTASTVTVSVAHP